MAVSDETLAKIADEVFSTTVWPREVSPFSDRFSGFGLEDAYDVVHEVRRRREARGERVVGRKIGFTNAAAWKGYGISGPIWNYLYDTTTLDLASQQGIFQGQRCPMRISPILIVITEPRTTQRQINCGECSERNPVLLRSTRYSVRQTILRGFINFGSESCRSMASECHWPPDPRHRGFALADRRCR
jgi:hypothetical protein